MFSSYPGWLMPPPVRRPQPRPIASVSKPLPSARASSSSSSLEPNRTPEESIDSINVGAHHDCHESRCWMFQEEIILANSCQVHTRLASPVLQNVSNQQRDAYDPSRPNDYMAYCTVSPCCLHIFIDFPVMTYSPFIPYGIQKERVQRKRDEEAKRELEKYRQEEERRLAEERAQGMSALLNASFWGRFDA